MTNGRGGRDAFHGVPGVELTVIRDRVEAVPMNREERYAGLTAHDLTPRRQDQLRRRCPARFALTAVGNPGCLCARMNRHFAMVILMGGLVGVGAAMGATPDPRCFELRTYYAAPGKLEGLEARFRDQTCKLFEKHGMVNLGYWVPAENPERKLVYLMAYPTRAARDASWKAFMDDPAWQAVWTASEREGKLVTKVEMLLLEATDYSPEIRPVAEGPRVFELRTYTAAGGLLGALHARFRDHTLGLFKKHGITSIGYWTPSKGQPGGTNTLVYLLAHKSEDAAKEAFARFREDPAWLQARKESEEKAGGSLTVTDGVKSVFLKPTDFSPWR